VRCHTLVAAAWVFFLVASGPGQVKLDNSPGLIRDVLRKGNTSGSVAYSSQCESADWRIWAPPHVHPAQKTGTALEVLRDMFSGDSKMQVTQDSNGMIRMVEKDVLTDILNVKIHHLVFGPSHTPFPFPELFHGPNMALLVILSSPEVRLLEEHHIVPTSFRLEGSMGQGLPAMTGELDDVSLSQALDYILKAFPGYWVYENCMTEDGRRTLHFWFY